jgi:hypothetical protein
VKRVHLSYGFVKRNTWPSTLDDDRRRGLVQALLTNAYALFGKWEDAMESGRRAQDISARLEICDSAS